MNITEIIGPIMIGPSSSHTAGAARIGRVAGQLLGERVVKARIFLSGSFAKTYKGHGTDRALAGGLLGMDVDDVRLRDSLGIAKTEGLDVSFEPIVLRDAHPNTVLLELTGVHGARTQVLGQSMGGGAILIRQIDGLNVDVTGEADTLIITHRDQPGVIAHVTGALSAAGLNIAAMRDFRAEEGGRAIMAIELDVSPIPAVVAFLKAQQGIERVTFLTKR